ncbi:hypothetical protein WN48_05239, partial [Eufriesea mexicana]
KTSLVPNVELITENVFVPIRKTIFMKKHNEAKQCNFSESRIEIVKLCQCSNSKLTMSLLKKPSRLPTNIKHEEVNLKNKQLRLINKNCNYMNDQSKIFSERSRNKKQTLVFPSSLFHLPLTSLTTCQAFSINNNVIKSNKKKWKESDKTNGKKTISSISSIVSNFSKTNGNTKDLKLYEPENVICRLRYNSKQTECLLSNYNGKIQLSENNLSNDSITSSNTSNISIILSTTTTETVKEGNVGKQCFLDSYCNSVLKKVGATVKETISDSTIDYEDHFLKTHQTNSIEDIHSKILDTHNLQCHPQENIDHSIHRNEHHHLCRIKYSWQVIGTSSQTSQTLLNNLVNGNKCFDDESVYNCSIKYSWQIIGIATQTSWKDFTASECHSAISFLSTNKKVICHTIKNTICDLSPETTTIWRKGKRFIVLNNQCTQTFAHKESQTVFTELHKNYCD